LTKKEVGVEDGRKGGKRKWVMTGDGGDNRRQILK
jgi:hypothetical protein